MNLYGYANGDPVNYSDPFGLYADRQNERPSIHERLADAVRQQARTWVNPTGGAIRGQDAHGRGQFGAPRKDGPHTGVDYVAQAGQDVVAVTAGEVAKIGYPYGDDLTYRYIQIETSDGYRVRQFYVQPAVGIAVGTKVRAGQLIGTQQPLGRKMPGITEHVDVKIWKNGVLIDPTPLIPVTQP